MALAAIFKQSVATRTLAGAIHNLRGADKNARTPIGSRVASAAGWPQDGKRV